MLRKAKKKRENIFAKIEFVKAFFYVLPYPETVLHGLFPGTWRPTLFTRKQKVREKSRECHNHKPQPFPDPKRKRLTLTYIIVKSKTFVSETLQNI